MDKSYFPPEMEIVLFESSDIFMESDTMPFVTPTPGVDLED